MEPFRKITIDELSTHDKETDAWMAINGKVYDVTDYIALHPGGKFLIMLGVGKDATTLFNEAHSYVNPDVDLNGKQVGVLKKSYRVCIPYSIDAERALRNTLLMTCVKPVTVSQFSPAEASGSVGSRNNEPTDTIQDRSELQPGPSNASQGPIIKYYYACSRKPDTVMDSHEEIEKPTTTTENDTPVQESRVPSETNIESDEQTSNESINIMDDDDSPRSH